MKNFKIILILILGYSYSARSSEVNSQRIYEIAPGSLYERIGLKSKDQIISYDNHPVNSVQDSMEMYNKLTRDEVNYLTIERDGKKVILAAKGHSAPPPAPIEYKGTKKMKKTSHSYSEATRLQSDVTE